MSGRKSAADKNANAQTDGGKPKAISSALAKAVAYHLEGKREEALRELSGALDSGQETAEIY
jgi:hypothetical protein